MRKRFLIIALFIFALYSVSFQTSRLRVFYSEARQVKAHKISSMRKISSNESEEQQVLQQRAELEEEPETNFNYSEVEKIKPVVPNRYRYVVVKSKFRVQSARMSVDEGTSFIFA